MEGVDPMTSNNIQVGACGRGCGSGSASAGRTGGPSAQARITTQSYPLWAALNLKAVICHSSQTSAGAAAAATCYTPYPQARHSYTPSDIRMNERFVPIELKLRKGELGLDFSGFDATTERALQAGGAEDVHGDGFATFLMPMPNAAAAAANGPNGASGPNGVPLSTLATSNGGANGVGAGGLHTAVAMGPDTGAMLAAAMSGDLRTHMQQLRSQSIRSLTTPLPAPALVPSVSGSGGSFALMPQHVAVAAGTHPLGGGSRLGTAGGGVPAVGASGTEMRDLCDAVLTDVGCSPAVKRQAAALKEALMAMELMPRGPADLAGRPLL